jgi:type II secretory pathway component GspD/PulD (secretin)
MSILPFRSRVKKLRTSGLFTSRTSRVFSFTLATLLIAVVGGAQAPKSPPATSSAQPDKGRAQKAIQAAHLAEQTGDLKAAYESYSEAVTYAPANKEYPLLREHARFRLIQGLTDVAERQAIAGDLDGARELLKQALAIDPNYSIARERLLELTPNSVIVTPEKTPRLAGLPRLHPTPGTRDFDYRGTVRGAYEEIGKQFGVTIAFDGDLPDRSLRFQVPKLDFETAIMVLSRQTRTFTRVVDEHTMFVTDDSAQKIRDYAPEIEKNLLLPASVTTDEMNETVRMIREITGISRTQLNTATRTLTVRSTEENVALAQAIIEQIEQPHGEVMLEIEILNLDRDAAHQLGITPPSSEKIFTLSLSQITQLQQAQNAGTLVQLIQNLFGTSASLGGAAGALLPPLVVLGGGKSLFLATVPGASANFSQSLSTVRSAQRVLLRAQDGKPATFFVGDRYPISLGILSASLTSSTTALAAGVLAGLLPRTDYNTGNAPVAVAAADFNGDGHQDLVVANQTDGTISIFFGVGDGTFGTATNIAVGKSPSAIAVGDFNGDNNVDIAVTNSGDDTVSILLGRGDGTFAAGVTYPTGLDPVSLLAQDFDGDGQPDLAVVNQGDGTNASTVSILLGNKTGGTQDGTFAAKVDYPVGVAPVAVATADFNTDGFLDLAVSNHADNSVSVLFGKGDGTFGLKTDYATGNGPEGIATADFNLDGRPDLAVTNQTDSTVSILLGNSDGTFGAHTDFTTGSGPVGILAGDFIGNGSTGLAIADATGDQVSILVGNGDGTFTSPIGIPTGNGPVAVASADLNGDGTLDLVAANETSNSITVTLNTLQPPNSSSTAGETAYPSAEYVDLGLKIKATPRLHGDDEVTLHLEFDIRSLAGTSINGIPILTNRTLDQTIRLRENETSVLAGLIESNEARTISGLPWTATAPVIGLLTGENTADLHDTEMLIIVTPRSLRLPPHESRALYAGHGEPSSPATPLTPFPGGPPPQQGPQPGAQPQPGVQPAPATPGNGPFQPRRLPPG